MDTSKILDDILDAIYLAKDTTKIFPTFPEHIKTSHLYVLYAIYQLGNEVRVTDISNKMLITLPNITNLVKELEKLGLVKKRALETDKRVSLVRLTDEGFHILDKYYLDYNKRVAKKLETKNIKNYQIMIECIKELNSIISKVAKEMNQENEE
ncbi:MarR family winged helix-turn-helix transcriptional regulator [Priestia flexa]|uniref:MarR family winged helix-turn-helix transcriptional regulator n=1 Tax=Priestia flexa TaxID=86664 RepID=UPI001CD458B2|nr:MarR family transcriptional regulator [Priestia flexa]MCA1202181.1 MarR family transcriptional regulator [Priestia flexa]